MKTKTQKQATDAKLLYLVYTGIYRNELPATCTQREQALLLLSRIINYDTVCLARRKPVDNQTPPDNSDDNSLDTISFCCIWTSIRSIDTVSNFPTVMSTSQVLLFLIVGKNEPLYEAEIHKRGAPGNSDAVARQNYFVVHSALDLVEKASWTTQNVSQLGELHSTGLQSRTAISHDPTFSAVIRCT